MNRRKLAITFLIALPFIFSCNSLDDTLSRLAAEQDLVGDPTAGIDIPSIDSDMAQLGKLLFYSKSLGGQVDAACVSCHHPIFGGGDDLALSIGVDALDAELLGPGRQVDDDDDGVADNSAPLLARNTPTILNSALWKQSFFWDGRIEVINAAEVEEGATAILSTPDSGYEIEDTSAGSDLVIAQSKFPITAPDEMLGNFSEIAFNSEFTDSENRNLQRDALAARLAGEPIDGDQFALNPNDWLTEFNTAFASNEDATSLITQDNIAHAIGTFERSMVFVDTPWFAYLHGDKNALTTEQKFGAILFYKSRSDGGAGCSGCHSGYLLSDERHHVIGFPQIGPGTGNGTFDTNGNSEDYGRENITAEESDRYKFRTTTLLNIEVTGPYSHSGSINTLEQAVRFCNDPSSVVDSYFENSEWCELDYLSGLSDCEQLYPNAKAYTQSAIDQRIAQEENFNVVAAPALSDQEIKQISAFLTSLTDPCVKDRECMQPWILEEGQVPDDNMLYGIDSDGAPL